MIPASSANLDSNSLRPSTLPLTDGHRGRLRSPLDHDSEARKDMDAKTLRRRQAANRATAKFIPALLTAIVIYATYVVIGPLCVQYLLNPPNGTQSANSSNPNAVPYRLGVTIAVLVLYSVLLLLMAACYLRLLLVVFLAPGNVPQGHQGTSSQPSSTPERTTVTQSCAPTTVAGKSETSSEFRDGDNTSNALDYRGIVECRTPHPPGLEAFYSKDVFVCDANGLPYWCTFCCNWKPDRAHHCSDVGRCVMKMDHFCPWVGGVVGERSFKFFVQFTGYTCLYTLYLLILMAYFISEATRKHDWNANTMVHWIIVLALSGLFFLFTLGMTGLSLQMACRNVTTIENIDHARRSMFLAILLPETRSSGMSVGSQRPLTATSSHGTRSAPPLPAPTDSDESVDEPVRPRSSRSRHSRRHSNHGEPPEPTNWQRMIHGNRRYERGNPMEPPGSRSQSLPLWQNTITYPLYLPPSRPPLPAPRPRSFAVVRTPPGMNPWQLATGYDNFKQIFGDNLQEWLLPIKMSPCSKHDRDDSFYPLGKGIERLKKDAKIVDSDRARSMKRRRALERGWKDGERPDAWEAEKAARGLKRKHSKRARES